MDGTRSRADILREMSALQAQLDASDHAVSVEAASPEVAPRASLQPNGEDVAVRLVGVVHEAVQRQGGDADTALVDAGFGPDLLARRSGWVTWSDYLAMFEAMTVSFEAADFREIGRSGFRSGWAGMFAAVGRAVTNELAMYRWLARLSFGPGSLFFRCLSAEVTELDEHRLAFRIHAPPSERLPPGWAHIMEGALESVPTLLGRPHAGVDTTPLSDGVLFTVTLPVASRGFLARLSGARRSQEALQAYDLLLETNERLASEVMALKASRAREAELEARLRDSQRLEAVGRLAGGIAHDYNNLLVVLMAHAEMLDDVAEDPANVREHAQQIIVASNRAAKLTQKLLALSRKEVQRLEVVDLRDLVSDLVPMLEAMATGRSRLELDLVDAPSRVKVDRGQVERVVMNLVSNALDALDGSGTVRLTVTHSWRPQIGARPARTWVVLEVADDGPGMDARTQRRAMEPFFTTKPVGKGVGLGLAIVYGIARQSGGDVEIRSSPGAGCRVDLLLPPYGPTDGGPAGGAG